MLIRSEKLNNYPADTSYNLFLHTLVDAQTHHTHTHTLKRHCRWPDISSNFIVNFILLSMSSSREQIYCRRRRRVEIKIRKCRSDYARGHSGQEKAPSSSKCITLNSTRQTWQYSPWVFVPN